MASFHFALLLLTLITLQLSEASRVSLFASTTDTPAVDSTKWAVLVAGSNSFFNYRHQADVCHAYQILKRGGLKDENIIVFMYDDIANSTLNPRPGVIINSPNGSDVYAGVPKDYTGDYVTAANFYAVLLGNTSGVTGGSGKVVASKPGDKIFVYFTDHGGPGVLCMPNMPYIYADDFIEVLKTKNASGTYDEMVIYVEACESGSIFEGLLPGDMNIYVTTASNANESSWGTYCPEMSPPPPPEYHTCLGDLYSIAWMEDSDVEDLTTETLEEQYMKVMERTISNITYGSHVMQYGTQRISSETVSVYQGSSYHNVTSTPVQSPGSMGVVDQRAADLYSMWQTYEKSTTLEPQQKMDLLQEIMEITTHRAHLDNTVESIKGELLDQEEESDRRVGSALVDDWDCLKSMIRTFETHCGSLTQYGMKHTRTFANMCNNGVTMETMDKVSKGRCSSYNIGQWNPATLGYSA